MTKYIPLLALVISLAVVACIPLKILSLGFAPPDDIRSNCGVIASGRTLVDYLVLNEDTRISIHVGWLNLWRGLFEVLGRDKELLMTAIVAIMFWVITALPLFALERSEALLGGLLACFMADPDWTRTLLGRPHNFDMAFMLFFGLWWRRLRARRAPLGVMAVLALFAGLASFSHAVFYLFAVPLAVTALSGEWRVLRRLAVSVLAGVTVGLVATGHAWEFTVQSVVHVFRTVNTQLLERQLVMELWSNPQNMDIAVVVALFLLWRQARRAWKLQVVKSPLFFLCVLYWILGFKVIRFWTDWGAPAVIAWVTLELHSFLKRAQGPSSPGRIGLALTLGLALFLFTTANTRDRWANAATLETIDITKPDQANLLPEPGGILYHPDMGLYNTLVYTYPDGRWKYILGKEPSQMPEEDRLIFMNILYAHMAPVSFRPWVEKLRPQDRIAIYSRTCPPFSRLIWANPLNTLWIGRLPASSTSPAAAGD
ncbi:MAG TPA: hypothetical protein PLU72_10110 [Candidatus Ozemobacteraceae bacterium]|nr:hypothetical protein [Candidatus Ozemobacteraceae bacterium]HQG28081.1 hypothetical protein [Candidatus Ozemobacteraceae bacterium]